MPIHTAAPLIPPRPTLRKLRDVAAEFVEDLRKIRKALGDLAA